MTGLIRAELAKLTTVRTPRWVLLAQVVLLVMAASGTMVSGALPPERLAEESVLRTLLVHGGVVAVFSLAVGITLSAGEFRHGTVVDTFLTEPRRERVMAAKLAAGLLAGLIAGTVVTVATIGLGVAWCAAKSVEFDWSVGWRSSVGILVWQALYTVIGVAIGAMIRAQSAAVITAVAWLYVAETALAQLVSPVARWLPATAATALGYAPGDALLSQAGGGLVLAGWTALAAAGALVLTARRDLA
jgi:ABC-2 type transport system permease protein